MNGRGSPNIGQLLISLRIAQGISQRELARRLNVHESQVSRDELDVRLHTTVGISPPRTMAIA
jgi:transcriptional regulator with XRE-family HTH domain